MKTTIDIPNDLFFRTKEASQKLGVTFKELVSEGLVSVLEKKTPAKSISIHPVTFKGNGISASYSNASWSVIRDASYEGRGS